MIAVYRELRPDRRLRPFVECGWVRSGPAASSIRVLPDGCVDLFASAEGEVLIAGPATGYYEVSADPLAGLRLRPGAAAAVLGQPARDFRDIRVPLIDTTSHQIAAKLCSTTTPSQLLALLEQMLTSYFANVEPLVDRSVYAAVEMLRRRPDWPVAALARQVGLSERQLRRRFDAAVGYGPKRLGRVFRFQRLLDLIHATDCRRHWAELAVAAGYVDQSHMINECVALVGMQPTALPGGMSVSSNTEADASP